jgi:hypothetical protein
VAIRRGGCHPSCEQGPSWSIDTQCSLEPAPALPSPRIRLQDTDGTRRPGSQAAWPSIVGAAILRLLGQPNEFIGGRHANRIRDRRCPLYLLVAGDGSALDRSCEPSPPGITLCLPTFYRYEPRSASRLGPFDRQASLSSLPVHPPFDRARLASCMSAAFRHPSRSVADGSESGFGWMMVRCPRTASRHSL